MGRMRDGYVRWRLPIRSASRVIQPRIVALSLGTLAVAAADWITIALYDTSPAGWTLAQLCLRCGGIALLLWAVLTPAPLRPSTRSRWGYRITSLAVLCLLALSVVVTIALSTGLIAGYGARTTIYDSDAAAFNHYNAELVLQGQNPYTADARFWDAIHQFPSVGATPLRQGRYANSQLGPSLTQLVKDVKSELVHPQQRGPEFSPASLHSYPALAFLVYVPGVWAAMPTTVWTSLLFALVFLLAAGWGAPRGARLIVWAVLFSGSLLVFWTLRGSFEVVALLPAALAWRKLDRRWLSAILLGLACAVKQIAWPLVPFYAIIVWRRHGTRAAVERSAVIAGTFLLPNLPFVLSSPRAWAASQLLPMSLPIFPSGVGLVALSRAGMLPLFSPVVYTVLEMAALALLIVWFARRPHVRAEVALILALVPFLLAWHSAASYFVVIPALAVYASLPLLRHDLMSAETPELGPRDTLVVAGVAGGAG